MPSRTRQPRPPSRSRFQEGSMNDRASTAPPVHFINNENLPPQFDYTSYKPEPFATVRAVDEQQQAQTKEKVAQKKTSRIFGQVWDGVFGMFGGGDKSRKKTPSMISTASTQASCKPPAEEEKRHSKEMKMDEIRSKFAGAGGERPTKEDVMQSYQELMAQGFFSAHAIQSTRHSRPNTASNKSARGGASATQSGMEKDKDTEMADAQWPLAGTPVRRHHQPHFLSPIAPTPGSASSRGTKRGLASPDALDEEEEEHQPRKLRKSISRDIAIPKLRQVTSRRILTRSSFSRENTVSATTSPSTSPNKLSKRAPSGGYAHDRPTVRAALPSPVVPTRHASRRNASEGAYVGQAIEARVLRPRRSAQQVNVGSGATGGSRRQVVVPDEGRGVPSVPAIPVEFTYGEDRETGKPWRGLRRT